MQGVQAPPVPPPGPPQPRALEARTQRNKRQCRRKQATEATASRITSDTWILVCHNLFFSPHTVFRLMMACKGLWAALRNDLAWWDTFFARIVAYQECLTHSNFLVGLRQYQVLPNRRTTIALVFSPRCAFCGARYGHAIVRPLLQRACGACLSSQLVSNRVLFHRYGLLVADFLLQYYHDGGLILPTGYYGARPLANLLRLTKDRLDFAPNDIIFLRRCDVERTLGAPLTDARAAQARRRLAAQRLAARMLRALALRRLRNAPLRCRLQTLEDLRCTDAMRLVHPVRPWIGWFPGGCYYASLTSAGSNWARRPGFTTERIDVIERLLRRGSFYRVAPSDSAVQPPPAPA